MLTLRPYRPAQCPKAILLGERARAAEASERQVLRLHSLLEQAEASSRALAQGKHDMGVEMSEALKLQLSQTEAKLDAELKATAAIKAAAAARESDLQQALASSTDALSETQHALTQARAQAAGPSRACRPGAVGPDLA